MWLSQILVQWSPSLLGQQHQRWLQWQFQMTYAFYRGEGVFRKHMICTLVKLVISKESDCRTFAKYSWYSNQYYCLENISNALNNKPVFLRKYEYCLIKQLVFLGKCAALVDIRYIRYINVLAPLILRLSGLQTCIVLVLHQQTILDTIHKMYTNKRK